MKRISTFLLILFSSFSYAQHFTGQISYKISFHPKHDSVNAEEIKDSEPGDSMVYLIKDGYYKATYFEKGKYIYSYTYHDETKYMYDDRPENLYITYRNSRMPNVDSLDATVYQDSINQVLGHECFLVKSVSVSGEHQTFYSDDVKINVDPFEGHAVGNWFEKLKLVDGCLALKAITERENYTKIREAVLIDKRQVNQSEFELPNKEKVASYQIVDEKPDLNKLSQSDFQCYRNKVASAPDVFDRKTKVTVYVGFVVSEKGEMKYIKAFEEDEYGLYRIAEDIVENCGVTFKPGKIGGEKVATLVYFPIEFLI